MCIMHTFCVKVPLANTWHKWNYGIFKKPYKVKSSYKRSRKMYKAADLRVRTDLAYSNRVIHVMHNSEYMTHTDYSFWCGKEPCLRELSENDYDGITTISFRTDLLVFVRFLSRLDSLVVWELWSVKRDLFQCVKNHCVHRTLLRSIYFVY